MKNIIITTIIFFSAVNLYAQTGGVEVYAKCNCSEPNNNKLVIDIFIQAENAAEDIFIAEQNYRFDYNEVALSNPTLLATGSDLKFGNPIFLPDGSIVLYSDASLYFDENDISVSADLRTTSGIQLSSTTPIYICSVQFDVLDATLPINFNWHDPTEFPPTYFSSNNGAFPVEVPAIFYDNLQSTVQENCSDSDGCTKVVPELSDLHIECGDDDGATIVIEAGDPDNVILEGKTLSYWINHPNFPQFYLNEENGYYYFEQLPAFESNVEDGNCSNDFSILITEDECPEGCVYVNSNLSDLHIECGDDDGATIVIEAGDPNNVVLEGKTLSYWINHPNFPKFYLNDENGYYYFEQLPAFESNVEDGNCNTAFSILITEDECLRNTINTTNHIVYPNPANKVVTVNIAGGIRADNTVSIYDASGKQVQSSALMPEQKSIQLNVENLTTGIYLIKVMSGDKTHTQKLTIAH